MKKKVLEICIDEIDDSDEITIDFEDDYTLVEKLGILEWAKAVILKTTENDNAMAEYNEEEA